MKKQITLFITLILVAVCMCGCMNNKTNPLSDSIFWGRAYHSSKEITLGGVKDDSYNNERLYIPYEINGYKVTKLGYSSFSMGGKYFNGLTNVVSNIKRLYCPSSVASIDAGYFLLTGSYCRLMIFYCGEVCSLDNVDGLEVYVPSDKFDEFYNTTLEMYKDCIKKANVCYVWNVPSQDEYYYVDYCTYGEKITVAPPDPQLKGYKFGGWYTNESCTTRWLFDQDKIPQLEQGQNFAEIRLYAKWTEITNR